MGRYADGGKQLDLALGLVRASAGDQHPLAVLIFCDLSRAASLEGKFAWVLRNISSIPSFFVFSP
jgi:hypothetical protein